MRRKDREIQSIDEKIKIIDKCKHCRLGLSENDIPYIIPLNYGYSYENNILNLFFHSAKDGKKIEIIKNNSKSCFEIDCDTKLIEGENACKFSYEFRSIIGFGEIIILKTNKEKNEGLSNIMKHQTGKNFMFNKEQLDNVLVFKMVVSSFTGKVKILSEEKINDAME
ncbi:MAG: pyridoxamine 5'-phosphate oxidase family protein [Treponema sp.]|nr:pyridoxamine 5'-phosphate oxidase family protein [Treponema sp.]